MKRLYLVSAFDDLSGRPYIGLLESSTETFRADAEKLVKRELPGRWDTKFQVVPAGSADDAEMLALEVRR